MGFVTRNTRLRLRPLSTNCVVTHGHLTYKEKELGKQAKSPVFVTLPITKSDNDQL